ncbi:hypothetical protein PFISCL1PPCAC_12006, partial [Pristionchus fissidentatus]
ISLSLLLIYLIKKFSHKDLGTYKHLLSCFATVDIILIFVHIAEDPKAICWNQIYGVISLNFLHNKHATLIYGTCFSVPYALLNIHFLYRYWGVKEYVSDFTFAYHKYRNLFIVFVVTNSKLKCIARYTWCYLGLTDEVPGTIQARAKLAQLFNQTDIDGWLIYRMNDQFAPISIISLLVFDTVMVLSIGAAVTLASVTYHSIHKCSTKKGAFISIHLLIIIIFLLCRRWSHSSASTAPISTCSTSPSSTSPLLHLSIIPLLSTLSSPP